MPKYPLALVMSCDSYQDTWKWLWKFWSMAKVPLNILLTSNYVASLDIPTLLIGEDRGWSKNAQLILERYVSADYFMLSFDDAWITAFDTNKFEDAISVIETDRRIGAIYLWHRPIQVSSPYNNLLDMICRESSDRIMLGTCLIRRAFMLDILTEVNKMERAGEPWRGPSKFGNPYDYELLGYPIAKDMMWETLAINKKENEIVDIAPHPIKEGYWRMPNIREIEKQFNIQIELGERPVWDDNNLHPPMFQR
jgi:hypothetical protein